MDGNQHGHKSQIVRFLLAQYVKKLIREYGSQSEPQTPTLSWSLPLVECWPIFVGFSMIFDRAQRPQARAAKVIFSVQ